MEKFKTYLYLGIGTVILGAGIYGGYVLFGEEKVEAQETIVVKIGEESYRITDMEVGAIEDIIPETYVAATPIVTGFKPVNESGNFIYNWVFGLKKEIELKYKAVVRWGFGGELSDDTVDYNGKTKTLTIKEPQLKATYGKELIFSDQSVGYTKYLFSPPTYDDADLYDKQSIEIVEDAIRERTETGRAKVHEYLKKKVNNLIENDVIKVPVEKIVIEESDEELYITNQEIEEFEITKDEEEYFKEEQEKLEKEAEK